MSVSQIPFLALSSLQLNLLSIISRSFRTIRINWGIIEEMENSKTPFILICNCEQFLATFYALKRGASQNSTQRQNFYFYSENTVGDEYFIYCGNKKRKRNWNVAVSTIQESLNHFEEALKKGKKIWLLFSVGNTSQNIEKYFLKRHDPMDLPSASRYSGLSQFIELAQTYQIPFLPTSFITFSHRFFSLPNGMHFPFPFSQSALSIGHPIEVENVPVDQSFTILKRKLFQLNELTYNFLKATGEN